MIELGQNNEFVCACVCVCVCVSACLFVCVSLCVSVHVYRVKRQNQRGLKQKIDKLQNKYFFQTK